MSTTPVDPTIKPLAFIVPAFNSIGQNVDELDGNDANDFFTGRHWHLDNTLNITNKMKTANGSAKFVIKATQVDTPTTETKTSSIPNFVAKTESTILANVDNRDIEIKFKPKKISAHFDLGFKAIGASWLNPYLAVTVPNSFTCINQSAVTKLGMLFHYRFGDNNSWSGLSHSEITTSRVKGGNKLNFSLVKKNTIKNNNFVVSHIANAIPSGNTIGGNNEVAVQYTGNASTAYVSGLFNGPLFNEGVKRIGGGVTHLATKDLGVAAEFIQHLDKEHQDVNFGVGYKHCEGLKVKVALKNFTTIDVLADMVYKKAFNGTVSSCFRYDIKSQAHAWGIKATFKQ